MFYRRFHRCAMPDSLQCTATVFFICSRFLLLRRPDKRDPHFGASNLLLTVWAERCRSAQGRLGFVSGTRGRHAWIVPRAVALCWAASLGGDHDKHLTRAIDAGRHHQRQPSHAGPKRTREWAWPRE